MTEITLPEGMSPEDVERILKTVAKKTATASTNEDYVEFANFENGKDQIRVYRDCYKGRETFNIRRFYLDDTGEWKYGKGLSFHYENIGDIVAGLEAMAAWAEEHVLEE